MSEYNVTSFGASPEAEPSVNASAIQKALDAANKAGGGRVVVPAGLYRTGTIRLRSHVEFHLEQGAVLLASENPADYNPANEYPENKGCAAEQWTAEHLIIAYRVEDVSVTGPGIVDGNAEAFFGEPDDGYWGHAWNYGLRWSKDKTRLRPGQLIVFILSKDIRIDGLFVRNSSCWSLFFHGCDNVTVTNYRVKNRIADANTDGIDIDSCANVTVSNCIIDTGDDSIAIRGNDGRLPQLKACENITITNCVLASSSSGVRVGVGAGTIRNVELGNLMFTRYGTGVIVQSSYGKGMPKGVDISHVVIHHCQFLNGGIPFEICPGDPGAVAQISNITFDTCRFEAFFSGGRVINSGIRRPRNVSFRDCTFRKTENPAPDRFKVQPEMLIVKGADNVSFRHCQILDAAPETFVTEDAQNLKKEDCNF